jgi:hypothetical protein
MLNAAIERSSVVVRGCSCDQQDAESITLFAMGVRLSVSMCWLLVKRFEMHILSIRHPVWSGARYPLAVLNIA